MIVTVKLFAMLRDKLPPESDGEAVALTLDEGTTARQVIQRLDIPPPMAHLVMINGYHLLPDEVDNRPLQDGETLSIFPPIAGG